jgi:hypothetical protein
MFVYHNVPIGKVVGCSCIITSTIGKAVKRPFIYWLYDIRTSKNLRYRDALRYERLTTFPIVEVMIHEHLTTFS